MTIQLQGLTQQQVQIADMIWSCDTQEAVDRLIRNLPPAYRQDAVTLHHLIVLECLEPYLDHYEQDAQDLIDRCSHS